MHGRLPTTGRGPESYKELGTRFPHAIVGGAKEPGKAYYDAMMWSPFGDLLTFDFVKAAIEGENLGNNPAGVPDILAHELDQPRLRESPVRPGEPAVARPDRPARPHLRGNCSTTSTSGSACRTC